MDSEAQLREWFCEHLAGADIEGTSDHWAGPEGLKRLGRIEDSQVVLEQKVPQAADRGVHFDTADPQVTQQGIWSVLREEESSHGQGGCGLRKMCLAAALILIYSPVGRNQYM